MGPKLCLLGVVGCLAGALACGTPFPPNAILTGTWGGDDAGFIVDTSGTRVHVHIGCTKGDIEQAVQFDETGAFTADGTHNIDAYPVNLGILRPATFSGIVSGQRMTLTVRLRDTAVVLGPVQLTLGRTPTMSMCPICRTPDK